MFTRAILGFLLLAGLAGSASAADALVMGKVQQLGPTQEEYGRAQVGKQGGTVLKAWRAHNDGLRQEGKPAIGLSTYADTVYREKVAASAPTDAVRDPHGTIRMLDAHHRSSLLVVLDKHLTGSHKAAPKNPKAPLHLPVRIVKDYTGWNHEDYSHDLVNGLGKGQFTHATVAEYKERHGEEWQRHIAGALGKTMHSLRNSDGRSVVGNALFEIGVHSEPLVDYAEFKIDHELVEHHDLMGKLAQAGLLEGGQLTRKLSADPRVLALVGTELKSEPMRTFIASLARDPSTTQQVYESLPR